MNEALFESGKVNVISWFTDLTHIQMAALDKVDQDDSETDSASDSEVEDDPSSESD